MPCKYCAAGNVPHPEGTTLMHLVLEDLPFVRVYQQCEDEAEARRRATQGDAVLRLPDSSNPQSTRDQHE